MTHKFGRFREYVAAGTWCLDHNKLVPQWPKEGTTTEIIDIASSGGGSACNFGIDLKRLDPQLSVSTIGRLGDDVDGRFLFALAQDNGLNVENLRMIAGEATPFTDAYTSRKNGNRTHIFQTGSNADMSPDDFDFTGKNGCFLHLGLAGAHATLDRANGQDASGWVTVLKKARAAGMTTNMEMMSITPDEIARLNKPCLPHLDLLIVNDTEVGALAAMTTVEGASTDLSACRTAAQTVMADGAMQVLVVHSPAHAFCLTRDGAWHEKPSVRVPSEAIVGANGAGDAFAAGFVCGLAHDVPLETSLAYGHAAAAVSLRHSTTTDAVESIEACLRIAGAWGWS